jgi:flagellar motility protein MotE (MotC chaperone)
MKRAKGKPLNSALRVIMGMLLVSGLIRLGTVGAAIARDTGPTEEIILSTASGACEADPALDELFDIIKTRTDQLDDKEFALLNREKDLEAADILIQANLERLIAAEERLAKTIDMVDGASEDDLGRLTAVYESMKPKTAADLFGQMTPDFAAGFLGRMAPQAAGAIMSGLSPEDAYAISVVLAGRNATVPKE